MNKGVKLLKGVTVSKIIFYTKTDLELIATIEVDGAKETAELLIDGNDLQELLKANWSVGRGVLNHIYEMWVYPTPTPATIDLEVMFGKPIDLNGQIAVDYCGHDNLWLVEAVLSENK